MAADVDQLTDVFARGRAPQQAHPAYRVAVIGGCRTGTHQRFDGREIRIGKDATNHLCIPDPTVSRFHCVIERRSRGLLLRDLESTNGTQLGGHWIECAYLAPNVAFSIGDTTLQLDLERSPELGERARILGNSAATA